MVIQSGGTLQANACTFAGALANNGVLECTGAGTASVSPTTVPGSTLRVLGSGGNASLTCAGAFTNNGALELTSVGAGYAATFGVTTGSLVNVAGATISALAGAGGSRSLTAQVQNAGTITPFTLLSISKAAADQVNTGTIDLTSGSLTLNITSAGASFTNQGGTIIIPSGRTLDVNGTAPASSTLILQGGSCGGAGNMTLSNLDLQSTPGFSTSSVNLTATSCSFAGPDTLRVDGGTPSLTSCTLNAPVVCTAGTLTAYVCDFNGTLDVRAGGTVESRGATSINGAYLSMPGGTLRLMGISSVTAALTAAAPFENHGLIEFTSNASAPATLTVAGTFTNAADGILRTLAGAGGARTLAVQFVNAGLADFQATTGINRAAAAHANAGTIQVAPTRTLTFTGASFTNQPGAVLTGTGILACSGATAFAQQGIVRPGSSAGTLTVNADYPCAASSVYEVEIGGDNAGTGYDQLAIRDSAMFAGALNLSLVGGYLPSPGRRYVIATFAARTGTFGTVNGLAYGPGQMWTVAYSDTDVVLLALDQTWQKLWPFEVAPAPRDGHVAVLDTTTDRMIVFGGRTNGGAVADAWVLTRATNGPKGDWLPLAPGGTPPPARTNASAAYDAANNRLIVYGGDDGAASPSLLGDAWVLTHANGLGGTPAWIALAPASTPPARSAAGAAYDAASNRLIVFGGNTTPGSCGGTLADAWVLENANGLGGAPAWSALAPTGAAPSGREQHGAAFDAATNRLVIVGGQDGCGTPNTEAWVLESANGLAGTPAWRELAPAQAAPAGWALARWAYDPVLHWIDGFGGTMSGAYVDTSFTLTGADGGGGESWYRRLFLGPARPARALHSMVLAPSSHVAVVFGGMTAQGRTNEVWRRDIEHGPVLAVDPPAIDAPLPARTGFARPPAPNPAAGEVAMAVDVARTQRVDVSVFDLAGRRVAALHSGRMNAGRHPLTWSGRGANGAVPPGLYLVRLAAEDRLEVARIIRLR
jgi:hypothetical protein